VRAWLQASTIRTSDNVLAADRSAPACRAQFAKCTGTQSEFEAALWRLIIAIGTRAPRVTGSALPLVAVLAEQGLLYFAWGCFAIFGPGPAVHGP